MTIQDPHANTQDSVEQRAATHSVWTSVAVNMVLSAAQILVGVIATSQALIADGVHSLSDLFADFVVLFASHHAKKDPDTGHPHGHHRFETGASLFLGLLLLAVGIGMLWSAYRKIAEPDLIQRVHVIALWVAGAALIAKETLFRHMLSIAQRLRSKLLVANAWHARSDAASSLVVGVGIIGNLAGYPVLDPIAALIVGLMVVRLGWKFAWDALNDLMDQAADAHDVDGIRRTLLETPGVHDVRELRTRKMGDMIVVDAHLAVDATISVEDGHRIAELARHRVLQYHRVLNLMTHVDPWYPESASKK